MNFDISQTILPLTVALTAGILIGLERGWQDRRAARGMRIAGVRTFALIGLLGGIVGLLAKEIQVGIIGFAFVGLALALIAGYALRAWKTGDFGATSLVAGLLAFSFGVAATQGFILEVAMGTVATILLLNYKSALHHWLDVLEPEEIHGALKLLAISVLVLPLLPNRTMDPWDVLNPFEIWWMVVLIAGLSFTGYFAMKIIGIEKGALLTGLLAGLASSTALTLHYSRMARHNPPARNILAASILVACGTMFPRTLIVASIVYWPIFHSLLVPALSMAAIVYLSAFIFWRMAEHSPPPDDIEQLRNPLELRSAILFGLLLTLILLAVKGLQLLYGDTGILVMAGLSGIVDVDAITLTLARLGGDDLSIEVAGLAIVLASAVNSLTKATMTVTIGGPAFGWHVAIPLALSAVTGLVIASL